MRSWTDIDHGLQVQRERQWTDDTGSVPIDGLPAWQSRGSPDPQAAATPIRMSHHLAFQSIQKGQRCLLPEVYQT